MNFRLSSIFGQQNWAQFVCLLQDNLSSNKRLAYFLGLLLIRCGSHRFNLTSQEYTIERRKFSTKF